MKKGEDWANALREVALSITAATKDDLQHQFLELVSTLPLYNFTIFPVKHKSQLWSGLPPTFDLAISANYILFLRSETKVSV
jgi:hypothetical protein